MQKYEILETLDGLEPPEGSSIEEEMSDWRLIKSFKDIATHGIGDTVVFSFGDARRLCEIFEYQINMRAEALNLATEEKEKFEKILEAIHLEVDIIFDEFPKEVSESEVKEPYVIFQTEDVSFKFKMIQEQIKITFGLLEEARSAEEEAKFNEKMARSAEEEARSAEEEAKFNEKEARLAEEEARSARDTIASNHRTIKHDLSPIIAELEGVEKGGTTILDLNKLKRDLSEIQFNIME